jgi:hypothetical protein
VREMWKRDEKGKEYTNGVLPPYLKVSFSCFLIYLTILSQLYMLYAVTFMV